MKTDRIKTYLRTLERDLWMRGLADAETLAEIESHLLEAVERGQARGLSLEEAERQALEHFGPANVVGTAFEKERKAPMQKVLLALGLLAGLLLAYVDSLPKWDDTGILVGMLLLTSGLLALLGYRRPWLLALAVGLWIPLHDVFVLHDARIFVVLLIPFVGAYAGWAVYLALRKTLHPA
ncbi:MAG: permease prefix domain 1-containing protein [Anaerolineales bacterium]